MKIAIVHEWLTEWAGSEKVLEQLLACCPSADVFSLVDHLTPQNRVKIAGKYACTSFIQRLPLSRSRPWIYLPLMPLAIEQFDLSSYDVVISSSHAVAKGVLTGPNQLHLSYVHSPMRYAWDLQHQYLQTSLGRGIRGIAMRGLLHYLRVWDQRTANGVDAFAANSRFIGRRIWKTYRRKAAVIYPPVAVEQLLPRKEKDDFFLCASRLMSYKRIDAVVDAFTHVVKRKLVVIGDGPEYKTLKRRAGPNILFLGYTSDEVLRDHLQRARAFIFAALEDFGILPVEAQACGTPVLAYGRGGALETVRGLDSPKPTGLFFESQDAQAVADAVARFEQNATLFSANACRENAERFSAERFRSEFQHFLAAEIRANGG